MSKLETIFYNIIIRIQYIFTGDCDHDCSYSEDFGCFVPEAGCPIHDVNIFN